MYICVMSGAYHVYRTTNWQAYLQLEKAKAAGQIRSLGLSNYAVEDFTELMRKATVTPTINQIEINPFLCEPHALSPDPVSSG